MSDVPAVPAAWTPLPRFPAGRPERRLFAHFGTRNRGRTVLLLNDGSAVAVDYPAQIVPADQTEGDPFTETGIGGYAYTDVARVFTGGHVHPITEAEAAQLTTGGFASGITYDTWESLAADTWESLDTWENP